MPYGLKTAVERWIWISPFSIAIQGIGRTIHANVISAFVAECIFIESMNFTSLSIL